MYRGNRRKTKTYYARFKVNGVAYLRKIGEEPQINAKVASVLRYEMIDKVKSGVTAKEQNIDKIFEEYIKLRSPSLSESWEYNMTKTYNKHLKEVIGHLMPSKVQTNVIQGVMNGMLDDGYAVSTVKQIKDVVSGMYSHMMKERENVGRLLQLPKFDNKIYFSISDEDAKTLYEKIVNHKDIKWRVLFSFLLHGRRRGEVITLEWRDIHLDDGYYVIRPENNKTNKRIQAPMLPFLIDMLKVYKKEGDSGYVFKGRHGNMISKSGVDNAWTKIKYAVGLEDMRLHDLRHLIGYVAINNGASLEEIGAILGHDSTFTTKRYSNMDMRTAKKALENVHKRFK
jgi:integrase